MLHLFAASLLWAFSFGLIKGHLTASDPWVVSFLRLALAGLAFLPWLLRGRLPLPVAWRAATLGALQFGLMYGLYVASFRYLTAYEVALWTIFTPLYVVVLDGARRRAFGWRAPVAALLATAGAAVVLTAEHGAISLPGILLVQGSNLCFAAGQVAYPRLAARAFGRLENPAANDACLLGWMYLGGTMLAGLLALPASLRGAVAPAGQQWLVLLYLGLVPTALGFALWNRGAARTNGGILAVANNLKVPLAVLVSWFVFGEPADHSRVLAGLGLLVGAVFLAGTRTTKE